MHGGWEEGAEPWGHVGGREFVWEPDVEDENVHERRNISADDRHSWYPKDKRL